MVGLSALLYYPYANINQVIEKDLRSLTLLFLFIYSGITVILGYSNNRNIGKALLIIVVFIEIGYINSSSIKERGCTYKARIASKNWI
jgi:hypothetical protein